MIKTDTAYNTAVKRLKEDRAHIDAKREDLIAEGLDAEQVARVLEPEIAFHAQLREEVEWYESVRRGDFQAVTSLQDIGRLLIALRIASGYSQREFAALLGVHESQVSRDERNEYDGVTADRAQEIVDVLHGQVEVVVRPQQDERKQLVLA